MEHLSQQGKKTSYPWLSNSYNWQQTTVKHILIGIYFTAVDIISISTEKELIAAMEEMRESPLKTA